MRPNQRGKTPVPAPGSRGLGPRGNRQLAEAADLVEFLVVNGDPNASRLLRPAVDATCYGEGQDICIPC